MIFYHEPPVRNKWPYRITSDTTLIFTIIPNGDRNVTIKELTAEKLVTITKYPKALSRVVTTEVYRR
jgi:hypothetical protein